MLTEGETAPDFTLEGYGDGEVQTYTLSDALRDGKPAILSFYIYDYSPVCTDQMCEVNDMEFVTFTNDAVVFGISTDGPYSHREFATDHDLSYPLLTDSNMRVYEKYGMVETTDDGEQKPKRGILVVDSERTIRYRWVATDNWDPWDVEPLEQALETVREINAN